jgi:hypothetical protein
MYYIVLILFLLVVIRFFYIRIKYPFWAHMSVYHSYDYHYIFLKKNRDIQVFPYKNKFTNPIQIKTISFYDLNETYIKYFVELLQCFYIPDDSILYTIVEKELRARFSGHFASPFISFYNEKNFVSSSSSVDNNKPFDILSTNVEISLFPEPKGCIASYPVHVFFHTTGEYYPVNYFTFISTDRSYKEQKISRNLISTHDYNIRRQNPEIRISILKKEIGNCEGVVPIIEFTTCLFQLNIGRNGRKLNRLSKLNGRKLNGRKNIAQVYRQNWDIMFDTLFDIYKPNVLFDFIISIDIGAIKSRIDAGILFVYAFCEAGNVLAMYFIENAHMLYEKTTSNTLRRVASFNNGLSDDLFQQGFIECLHKIIKQNLDYKMLLIDNVGHNSQIMENMKNICQNVAETSGAYYFLNWLFFNKVNRERVFILT